MPPSPELTCRSAGSENTIRVVCKSSKTEIEAIDNSSPTNDWTGIRIKGQRTRSALTITNLAVVILQCGRQGSLIQPSLPSGCSAFTDTVYGIVDAVQVDVGIAVIRDNDR